MTFNEDTLRADIVETWGEHGAHVDLFDFMLKVIRTSADRIDELEAALREIAKGKHVDPFGNILNQPSRAADIARRWLEGSDE